jgi:hypothetical protein
MPNRVDAAVNPMQPPSCHGTPDCTFRVAELSQLTPGHDAMLLGRQFSQAPMRSHFHPHTD